jgi:hypothetical protein
MVESKGTHFVPNYIQNNAKVLCSVENFVWGLFIFPTTTAIRRITAFLSHQPTVTTNQLLKAVWVMLEIADKHRPIYRQTTNELVTQYKQDQYYIRSKEIATLAKIDRNQLKTILDVLEALELLSVTIGNYVDNNGKCWANMKFVKLNIPMIIALTQPIEVVIGVKSMLMEQYTPHKREAILILNKSKYYYPKLKLQVEE